MTTGARFIRRARDLGFSVAAISDLLGLWRDNTRQSAEVKHLAQGHIEELEKKIRGLQDMANTLTMLVNACHGDRSPHARYYRGWRAILKMKTCRSLLAEELSQTCRKKELIHSTRVSLLGEALN